MPRKRKLDSDESENSKKVKIETIVFSEDELKKKKVAELKEIAESFQLSTKGKKAELIESILEFKGIQKEEVAPKEEFKDEVEKNSLFDFSAKDIDGNEVDFSKFRGKVCLIVNVASR